MNWKEIKGTNGFYEVSDTGLVRRAKASNRTYAGRVHSTTLDDGGYKIVVAYLGPKTYKVIRVHRAVATAFLGDPPFDGAQVNHKDGNKQNNNVSNLEWCTRSENRRHAMMTGLSHDEKPVVQLSKHGTVIAEFRSAAEASRATGANKTSISQCCTHVVLLPLKNPCRTVKGFSFSRLKDGSVVQWTRDGKKVRQYKNAEAAARALGVRSSRISMVLSGYKYRGSITRKTAGGFRWMFKEEYDDTNRDKS